MNYIPDHLNQKPSKLYHVYERLSERIQFAQCMSPTHRYTVLFRLDLLPPAHVQDAKQGCQRKKRYKIFLHKTSTFA